MPYLLRRVDMLPTTIISLFLAIFWTFCTHNSFAADAIMPLKEVKAGMKGVGKTVVHGHEIETFTVEVMGILVNNKINENVLINGSSILVRVGGKAIDEAGGIAAGMSGSPIYIGNRIIGGLSSGWVMTDHTVGLVTPIEEMLEIWEYPQMSRLPDSNEKVVRWCSAAPLSIGGKLIDTIVECDNVTELNGRLTTNEVVFVRAAAPMVIQGLSEKAVSALNKTLKSKKCRLEAVPASVGPLQSLQPSNIQVGKIIASDSLEPGSAIGIQLARGDINLTTLGTLTYLDGKRFLGFAHSFMKKGNVSFMMTGAHIYHCFSSMEMPFKIGAPTEVIGIITQDREKGVAGELGKFPTMLPIQLEVTDKDLKRTRNINFQTVRDTQVLNSVLESTLIQAIDGVIDRVGQGTALVGIALECTGTAGERYNLRREDLFYSKDDIIGTIISQILDLFETLTENELEAIQPTRLMLKIDLEQRRRTMTIEKLEVKNTSITPGGTLEAWVTMRPYREKAIVKKISVPIPHDIGKDNLTLTVYGLASNQAEDSSDTTENTAKPLHEKSKITEPSHESFESIMRSWVNAPRNSDLLIQLSVEGDDSKKVKIGNRDFLVEPTNLVVLGRVDSTITLGED